MDLADELVRRAAYENARLRAWRAYDAAIDGAWVVADRGLVFSEKCGACGSDVWLVLYRRVAEQPLPSWIHVEARYRDATAASEWVLCLNGSASVRRQVCAHAERVFFRPAPDEVVELTKLELLAGE